MGATAPSGATAPAGTVAPPPSSGGVEQPPYAPSACSDRYPCNDDRAGWEARIRVPAGFQATYFARINGQPTRIISGPDGLLYVATMGGTIFTIDSGGNIAPYVSGLIVPTGLAFQPGTSRLYVTSRVSPQSVGGEAQVAVIEGGGVRQIIGGLPCCYTGYHAANDVVFGPDGFGYVSVGSRADHGEILEDGPNYGLQDELHPYEAAILRFSPDGSSVSVYARGLRNAYGIAWDANGQLYATDNGPDGEPGWNPPDLLHRVQPGREHGYPWYECSVCFSPPPDVQIVQPIYRFVPHSSVTGITAYLSNQFPGYHNSLFVALWSAFPGAQKIMRFGPGGVGASNFATGFAAPIDTAVGPDGSLYVADWATGIIFKIRWVGN
jgi:glucose/arabinose dehydrogenase